MSEIARDEETSSASKCERDVGENFLFQLFLFLFLGAAERRSAQETVERARRRLASFDVVGVTECTRRYWAALAAAIVALNVKLAELPSMLKGENCSSVNVWGWGMDDVLLLAWLRRLTCIKGVEFPEPIVAYMSGVGKQVVDYKQHAV